MPAPRKQGGKRKSKPFVNRIDKAGPGILEDLAFTNKTRLEIAKSRRVGIGTVTNIAQRYGLRSEKIAREIGGMATGLKLKGKPRGPRKERKFLFSRKEKTNLLEEHRGALIKSARFGLSAERIRRMYAGDFDLFLEKMKKFVFENLDLYDPEVKGKDGKTATPFTWIVNSAKLFCLREYNKAAEPKEKQMPVGKKGLPISQTDVIRRTKEARLAKTRVQWISRAAYPLLKKLGLNPDQVAKLGFADIKKQIIEFSESRDACLTERDSNIVRRKLEGQRRKDIAHSMETSTWTISVIESSAAQKIKEKIREKIKKKRASSQ